MANAYLRPLALLRQVVSDIVQKLWPHANRAAVNMMFAGMLVGILCGVGSVTELRTPPGVYRTQVGEIRTVRLEDGSVVQLAPKTEVIVQYVSDFRSVRVRGGEAYFVVHPDESRPFQVSVSGRVVRALGTAFAVRDRPGEPARLLVVDGNVNVFGWMHATALKPPESAIRVGASQLLSLEKGGARMVHTLVREEVWRNLAWRNGRIVIYDEPLASVLEQVNLFNPCKLVIDDPSMEQLRVSGAFRATDIDKILAALRNMGIQHREVQRSGCMEIHLFRTE